jgi:hypothetical protein
MPRCLIVQSLVCVQANCHLPLWRRFWEASPGRKGMDDLTQDTNTPALPILGAASSSFSIKPKPSYPFTRLTKTLGGMHFWIMDTSSHSLSCLSLSTMDCNYLFFVDIYIQFHEFIFVEGFHTLHTSVHCLVCIISWHQPWKLLSNRSLDCTQRLRNAQENSRKLGLSMTTG